MISLFIFMYIMVNIIHIFDSKKINNTEYIIRLIKRYHITLLDIFPKVLNVIIQEYIDDIIEISIILESNIIYRINVKNQYINYMPISLTFCMRDNYGDMNINCYNISNNIITNSYNYMNNYNNMWHIISNTYLRQMYEIEYFYDISGSYPTTYIDNTFTYEVHQMFTIINHKLFKNILIIMQILFKYIQKKLTH